MASNKTTHIDFKCDQDMKDKLQEVAKQKDIPLSQILRDLVKEYLNKQ